MNKKQIVSFSGGKDSTAMLHMMLERGEQIDEVIYFDGGWEWPQMHRHIDLVEEKSGIKITRLKPEKDFNWWMYEHKRIRSKYDGPGYGWPVCKARWCTKIKQMTIAQYLKSKYPSQDIIQCIGYAVGEERRLKIVKRNPNYRFPLLEYNIDETEALLYCYKLGYNWGGGEGDDRPDGLYEYFDRVSCFCCPLQNKRNLFLTKRHFPKVYSIMMEMDKKQARCDNRRVPFKENMTLQDYDKKLRGKDEPFVYPEEYNKKNKEEES